MKPHKYHFFRRAVRELRAADAIKDPAIVRAHRRVAALYLERGARIGATVHAKARSRRGAERREARS